MKKKILFVSFCLLTALSVNAESSGGGRHDHDGSICIDSECSTSIICSDSSYSNNCDSFLSPTIGNYTYYLTESSYNNDNKSALPSIKKVESYNNSLNITIPYFESTSKKFVDYLYNNGNYQNRYLGGFYSPLLRGYFKKGIHYRYQYTLKTVDWTNSSLTPKSFDLSEFKNNTKIYAYNSDLESINGIDNYQISYHWNIQNDNTINITVYCDFVPSDNLYEVYIVDGITPVSDGVIGNRSNLYFSYFSSNGYNRSLEYVSNSAYLLRFTDEEYSTINKDNTITFYSDGTVSFENDIRSCGLTDIACHIHNVKTVVSGWFDFLTSLVKKILDLITNIFTTIYDAIVDALKFLFVPTETQFNNMYNAFNNLIDEHFAILKVPFTVLHKFYDMITSLDNISTKFIINIPEVTLGDFGTLIHPYYVNMNDFFDSQPYRGIYEFGYNFMYIIITFLFIRFLDKARLKLFGGV